VPDFDIVVIAASTCEIGMDPLKEQLVCNDITALLRLKCLGAAAT